MAPVHRVVLDTVRPHIGDMRPRLSSRLNDGAVVRIQLNAAHLILVTALHLARGRCGAQCQAPDFGRGREAMDRDEDISIRRSEPVQRIGADNPFYGALARKVLGTRRRGKRPAHHLVATTAPAVVVNTHVHEDDIGAFALRAEQRSDALLAIARGEAVPLDDGPGKGGVGYQAAVEVIDDSPPPCVLGAFDPIDVNLALIMTPQPSGTQPISVLMESPRTEKPRPLRQLLTARDTLASVSLAQLTLPTSLADEMASAHLTVPETTDSSVLI